MRCDFSSAKAYQNFMHEEDDGSLLWQGTLENERREFVLKYYIAMCIVLEFMRDEDDICMQLCAK